MEINVRDLDLVYVKKIRIDSKRNGKSVNPAKDEFFLKVPNADNYAFSTYGRLYKKSTNLNGDVTWARVEELGYLDNSGNFYDWHKDGKKELENVKSKKDKEKSFWLKLKYFPYWENNQAKYSSADDAYMIKLNDGTEKAVKVTQLIKKCLKLPADCKVYNYSGSSWAIKNIHVLTKDDYVEALQSKMEHRKPTYSEDKRGIKILVNLQGKTINKWLHDKWWAVRTRGTNQKCKERFSYYSDTTVHASFLENPDYFKSLLLSKLYYYPGKLEVDKDLFRYGFKASEYAPDTITLLPKTINVIFVTNTNVKLGYNIQKRTDEYGKNYYFIPKNMFVLKGQTREALTFATYLEALQTARKLKADHIRDVANEERKKGYMPEIILAAMDKWADLCEAGLIKKWEPSEEVLKREINVE